MFHRAVELNFGEGTELMLRFKDGSIRKYDVSLLFEKYPQMKALADRSLFLSGKLMGYGIIWSDELDLEVETIYQDGDLIGRAKEPAGELVSDCIASARAISGLTQKQLAERSNIDQSDISKIERGMANPSVSTMERLAEAMGGRLELRIVFPDQQ